MSLHDTNCRCHGQNTGTLTKLQKSFQNSEQLFLQLAMTTVETYRIKFESLSICQYKLSNIWIHPEVIFFLQLAARQKGPYSV